MDNTHKIEIEQLREDNKRLLKLLKQTNEYKDFSNFVDDSGGLVRNLEKENKPTLNIPQIEQLNEE